MEAITVDGTAVVDLKRCIGCGLCVTTCTTAALRLEHKSPAETPEVPANNIELYLKLARERGALAAGYRENGGEIGDRPNAVQIGIGSD